jgi:heterotetrameric sarcosine oxidase delta subunit
MIRLECPWCGLRNEEEFVCGGQAHIERPANPQDVDDAQWADYLYQRDNPKGPHRERWQHRYGCGQWFNVLRDTVSHEVLATYLMGEDAPAVGGEE